jgi:hypothetical protein
MHGNPVNLPQLVLLLKSYLHPRHQQFEEVVERMYEKRRIIQARKKRLANAVSIFYDIEIILLLLITDCK